MFLTTCFYVISIFSLWHPTLGLPSSDFQNPAADFRPKFRYWLPDASVSSSIVAKDIQDVKDAGAGGLEVLPFYLYGAGEEWFRRNKMYPIPEFPDWSKYGFGTPAFVDLFKDSLNAARDVGIKLDFALGANQGQGVPSEVGTPGLAVELLLGNTTITPDGSFSAPVPQPRQPSSAILSGLSFMHPLEQFGTPNLSAVIAYQVLSSSGMDSTGSRTVHLNESSFIDLTSSVEDDWSLQWTPPDTSKTWKIFSFWEAYTNQKSCDGGPNATTWLGNGSWTVDHFSKSGAARVTDFWDEYILSDDEVVELLKTVGKYAWEDSMEILASLYWTPNLLKRFKSKHKYDLLPYLPLLFSPTNTWNGALPVYDEVYAFGNDTKFGNSIYQIDYRQILNDGYQDYLLHFQEWTHSIGTQYSTQPGYNLPLQMLSDIPLLDAPEGESLGFSNLIDAYRQFAGPAHLYNKSIISTELGAVNVAAYTLKIPALLQQVKRSLAGGFTTHVLHGFPSSTTYVNTTWPGYTTFWYEFTDMWNQIQPAWQHMSDALDFIGRNQWLSQQGNPKVDLALYLYASPWSPKTQLNSTVLRDLGFTYDYLGPDNLVSSEAFVRNGRLGVPQYQALIFNNQSVISVEAVESLIVMTSKGFPIIFVGSPPAQSIPSDPASQGSLNSSMKRLLAQSNVYQVDTVDQLPSILAGRTIKPAVALNCSSDPVFSLWRSSQDVDYIYIFNDQSKTADCTGIITASSVIPYIYNAWTGVQSSLLQYTKTNSTLSVPLTLKSNETIILALHKSSSTPTCSVSHATKNLHSLNYTDEDLEAVITGPVTLSASSGRTLQLNTSVSVPVNLTSWNLVIEDWHSAPDRLAVRTEITNHTYNNISLVPWLQLDPKLTPVSGVGHYTTSFTVPTPPSNSSSLVGILSLPLVQHTARVFLDGKWLGPIDPVNPVLTLQELKSGTEHTLKIDVTTTLFNRIKAEANETWIAGQVAGVRQTQYNTLPYEKYGLVGSVVLKWGERVKVDC